MAFKGLLTLVQVYSTDWALGRVFSQVGRLRARETVKKLLAVVIALIYLRGYRQIGKMKKPNLYARLGLSVGASAAEINRAAREVALLHHPDRNAGNAQIFVELIEYTRVLKDPTWRWIYDRFGLQRRDLGRGERVAELFFDKYLKMMAEFAHLAVHILISALLQRHYRFYPIFMAYMGLLVAVHILIFTVEGKLLSTLAFISGQATPHELIRIVLQNFSLLVLYIHYYVHYFYGIREEAMRQKLIELHEHALRRVEELKREEK